MTVASSSRSNSDTQPTLAIITADLRGKSLIVRGRPPKYGVVVAQLDTQSCPPGCYSSAGGVQSIPACSNDVRIHSRPTGPATFQVQSMGRRRSRQCHHLWDLNGSAGMLWHRSANHAMHATKSSSGHMLNGFRRRAMARISIIAQLCRYAPAVQSSTLCLRSTFSGPHSCACCGTVPRGWLTPKEWVEPAG